MARQQITKRIISLILIITLIPISALAGIEKLIKNTMPSGTMSNVTSGAIINEQSAGHLMGGSVILKTPAAPDLQFLSMQAPSCKLGGLPCGIQLDLRAGGLSFVKSAEMMKFLKQIVQQAGTYAGIMMIKSICPHCEDIMTFLNDVAQTANQLGISQCRAMEMLANGPLSKLTAGAQGTRQSSMVLGGGGSDMIDYQEKSKADTPDPRGGEKELESLLGDNYNLVWKALEKKAKNSEDGNALKELLMSISGTIIGKKDENSKRSVIHKKSLASKELIKELIGTDSGSSELQLYKCDKADLCLEPTIEKTKIKAEETLRGSVAKLMVSIAKKIQINEGKFTAEEETLITLSSLSIIKKLELDLATYADFNSAAYAQGEFLEALCFDVVTSYMAMLLAEVEMAVSELSYAQITDTKIFDAFSAESRETMRNLSIAKEESFRRYDLIAATKARIAQQDQYFNRKFEEFVSNQYD
jgi:conjugative transfer pilus assembly protein TraH